MSILLSLKSAAIDMLGSAFFSTIKTDMIIIENEANRVAAIVKPTSIVLGAVERNTWPAAGSATVALTDVFANGQIGNLPAGNPDAGINTNAGVMLHRFKANGAIEVTADPVLNMDVATKQWVEARVGDYSLDTGTANAKVLALNPVITAYSVNFVGTFKNAVLNTGPCTINFGGGIVPLVSGTGAALGGGDLPAGIVAEYQYIVTDNKAYITTLRLPPSGAAAAAIASAATVDLTSVQNGGIVHISGTVATSALTMFTGQTVTLIADAAWPLTYNATTMKIADGASYTCTAGNVLLANKDVGGVINLIILSGGNNIKKPGDIFVYSGTTAPAGAMAVPVAAADVSRAIYAALFAAIGTTWGVGVGGLTFGIPFVPADYAILQANGNVGTISVGSVISHLHGGGLFRAGSALTMSSTAGAVHGQGSTDAAGGAANLAAGVRFLLCLQYQ